MHIKINPISIDNVAHNWTLSVFLNRSATPGNAYCLLK